MIARRFASRQPAQAARANELGEIVSVHGPRFPRVLEATAVVATLVAGAVAVAVAAVGLARW